MTDVTNIFSQRLRELRNGENQEKTAKNIGISRGALSYYESGERKPDINVLHSIAKYYNVSTDYLLGLTDIPRIDLEESSISNQLGLSSGAIHHLKFLNERITTDHSNEYDSLDSYYQSKTLDELNLHIINSLIVNDYELTGRITDYLFTHFSHFSDFANGENYYPITNLELYDERLNLSYSDDYDLFSNALLLEIQKTLMQLRNSYSKKLNEHTSSDVQDYSSACDAYQAVHNFILHGLAEHRKW